MRAIYMIKHIISGKVYVGSAENYNNRAKEYIKTLASSIHHNKYLQNTWNKYYGEGFVFGIIEEISKKDDIIAKEQYWLDYYNAGNKDVCFNILTIAYSTKGYKFSKESRKKMSEKKKGKSWTNKQKEVLGNIERSKRPHLTGENSKLSKRIEQYDLDNNFIKEWESINLCSIELGLHKSNIISCLKKRISQTGGYVFKYK